MKWGYLGVVLGLSLILLAGCLSPNSESQVIHVAYLPSYHSLPLFVAVERGMFEKAGLKVEVQRIETPKDIIDALVTGKIDAGSHSVAAGITTIVESQNPGALKVYSLACSYDGQLVDELLLPADSTITSISELKGKKIGHIPGPQWATMTKKVLLANGVNPSEVTLIELPASTQLSTLAAHGIDALFTLEPIGTIGVQKNAVKILIENPFEKNVVDPWCGGAGVVSAKFVNARPEVAKKFIEVMNAAAKESENNPETRKYLVQYLQLPEDATQTVDLPKFIPISETSPEVIAAYQTFADVFFELGVTTKKIDVKNLFWSGK